MTLVAEARTAQPAVSAGPGEDLSPRAKRNPEVSASAMKRAGQDQAPFPDVPRRVPRPPRYAGREAEDRLVVEDELATMDSRSAAPVPCEFARLRLIRGPAQSDPSAITADDHEERSGTGEPIYRCWANSGHVEGRAGREQAGRARRAGRGAREPNRAAGTAQECRDPSEGPQPHGTPPRWATSHDNASPTTPRPRCRRRPSREMHERPAASR